MALPQELFNKWKVVINGEVFTPADFTDFQNTNSKVYAVQPERTLDFSIPDIRDLPTAKIPRLRVSFELMTIETYRRLLRAVEPNEFTVTYYDYEYDKVVDVLMYIQPQDIDTVFNTAFNKLVVLKKTVDFVATMNELVEYQITYDYNGGLGIGGSKEHTEIVKYQQSFVVSGSKDITKNGYTNIIKWNTKADGKGTDYMIGSTHIPSASFLLFAVWG